MQRLAANLTRLCQCITSNGNVIVDGKGKADPGIGHKFPERE